MPASTQTAPPTNKSPHADSRLLQDLRTKHGLLRPLDHWPERQSELIDNFNSGTEALLNRFDEARENVERDQGLNDRGKTDRIQELAEKAKWDIFEHQFQPTDRMLEREADQIELPTETTPIPKPVGLDPVVVETRSREVRDRLRTMKLPTRKAVVKQAAERGDVVVCHALDSDPFATVPGESLLDDGSLREMRMAYHRYMHADKFQLVEALDTIRTSLRANFAKAEAWPQAGRSVALLAKERGVVIDYIPNMN